MRGLRHPYSGLLYELGEHDGEVIVTDDREPGAVRSGRYDTRGTWLSGEQLRVCPHMCIWVGEGPRVTPPLSTHRRFMNVRDHGDTGVAAQ